MDHLVSSISGQQSLLPALDVALNIECREQHGQRSQVGHIDHERHRLLSIVDTVVVRVAQGVVVPHKSVEHGQGAAKHKLADLERGEYSFGYHWHPHSDTAQGEVEIHQRVDKRVEHHKNPDGRRPVSDAAPHTHHGARMVVALQKRRGLPLEQDDDGVDDLVEFQHVEPPAENGQVLRHEVLVENSVFHVTHGVHEIREPALGVVPQRHGGHRFAKALEHADKRPHRVDAKKHVVQEHEQLEQGRFCYVERSGRQALELGLGEFFILQVGFLLLPGDH
uniref:Uncharacterized protein n=1 Tax=Candidozyma auris TaxID=498019 RepID=A0A0L0NX30_CANAR